MLICSNELQPIYQISKQEVSMNLDCSLQAIDLSHGRNRNLCVTIALYRPSTRDCIAVVSFARGPTSRHQSCLTVMYYITGM